MKIALVITVKNEEEAIGKLLESVVVQTIKPFQIIISDAGSIDKTKKIINSFKDELPQIRVINVDGSNRAKGRNFAIKKSSSEIIAVTDAGCILKKDWLEKITKPIMLKKAESVAGFYISESKGVLERTIAPFVAVMPDNFNKHEFLPSSRSIAFLKKSWDKVGGYPEKVDFCEDLVFARKLKDDTKMKVVVDAIVYWKQVSTLGKFYNQIKNYAMGDVEARYWPHIRKIGTVYLRYLLFWLFPPLFYLYLLFPIIKHMKYVKHPLGVIYLPLVQIISDFGVIAGSLKKLL